MKVSLYDLLKVSLSDPDSPNILLTVHLSDLHQLVVWTLSKPHASESYPCIWMPRKSGMS